MRSNVVKTQIKHNMTRHKSRFEKIIAKIGNSSNNSKLRQLVRLIDAAEKSINDSPQNVVIRNVPYTVTYQPSIEFVLKTHNGKTVKQIVDVELYSPWIIGNINEARKIRRERATHHNVNSFLGNPTRNNRR